ncbi:MAG: ABC transporter ATP-binding protein [Xanthomonadales bacterium]|nr:ABC transporter ATP-binding protein [Xanthomonadales bacterium]
MRERPPTTVAALTGVTKRYGAVTALDNVDLALHAGELLALLGPNGAGKSTALGLLTGRLLPDAGRVQLYGQDPTLTAARRRIGVMLQEAKLPETLKVRELVALFASYYPAPRDVAATLELAGLSDLAGRRYEALSGGQQRRVQFALALVGNAPLLFVDEPTTGLDVEARRGLWQVLAGLKAAGTSIVLTTHYLEEADALADRIVVIDRGRIRAEGSPSQIKSRARGAVLRFSTSLSEPLIAAIPGVQSVSRVGERFAVQAADSDALLRLLLLADPNLADLEIQRLSLEDALLTLTGAAK